MYGLLDERCSIAQYCYCIKRCIQCAVYRQRALLQSTVCRALPEAYALGPNLAKAQSHFRFPCFLVKAYPSSTYSTDPTRLVSNLSNTSGVVLRTQDY